MGKQLPKYKEIERDILNQIQSGALKTGDQIETENELCERYKVSRMTARKALDLLSSPRLYKPHAGKGNLCKFYTNFKKSQLYPKLFR